MALSQFVVHSVTKCFYFPFKSSKFLVILIQAKDNISLCTHLVVPFCYRFTILNCLLQDFYCYLYRYMHHNTQLPFPYVIILFMYKHSLTRDCYFDVVNSISPHLPRCYTDVDRVRQTGGNTRSGDKDIDVCLQ